MTIKFKARVLLELGAELISSDAVALYELVKNGIDAGSESIALKVQVFIQPSAYRRLLRQPILANTSLKWEPLKFASLLQDAIDKDSPSELMADFWKAVGEPKSRQDALSALKQAIHDFNFVSVSDTGDGMSVADLQVHYLTVGTPARLHQKKARLKSNRSHQAPLGEKGIGRLAAMRIGHHITVVTATSTELRWNELIMDWRPVIEDPDLDAGAIDFQPRSTSQKKNPGIKGTQIVIRDLQSDWSPLKLQELAKTEFAKLKDPFLDNYASRFLLVSWQGKSVKEATMFQSSLLEHADAHCVISFRTNNGDPYDEKDGPTLSVNTNYRYRERAEAIVHAGAHLCESVSHEVRGRRRPKASDALPGSDEVVAALASVGDFDAEFHWFNRGRLMRESNELWEQKIGPFVRTWNGGLLVYRDGYRVYPYGSPSDDWLDLDRKALSSGAYKLNRGQIVGYLRISSEANPHLQDQTNREGFRDGPEKEALRRLLRQAIVSDCKTFLESVDKQNQPATAETIKQLQNRIDKNQRAASSSLKLLKARVPAETSSVNKIIAQLREVEDAWGRAKQALEAHEEEIERYIHLAGVGLMVELIAHELSRTTEDALELLAKKSTAKDPKQLAVLEAQIKTLNKRVRVLDELSIPGRQSRLLHDVGDIITMMVEMYEAKATRDSVIIEWNPPKKKFKHKLERGQMLQILDNLLSNAVYWLNRRTDRTSPAKVSIFLDPVERELRIEDNGPGISKNIGEKVFTAFYTTKPSGEGRGLGLYIAKRLAEENSASLDLSELVGDHYRGFILRFAGE